MKEKKHNSAAVLKKIIQELEVVPAAQLGITMSEGVFGTTRLFYWKEFFQRFDNAFFELLRKEFPFVSVSRNVSSKGVNCKSSLMDTLYARYLLMKKQSEFAYMMRAVRSVSSYEDMIRDRTISPSLRAFFLREMELDDYMRELRANENKRAAYHLVRQFYCAETREHYRYFAEEWKEYFRPVSFAEVLQTPLFTSS